MVEEFVKEYVKLIVEYPDKIKVEKIDLEDGLAEILIYADKVDTGKLIGKDGKMINAIKTVIVGYKAKDPTSYKVTVKAVDK